MSEMESNRAIQIHDTNDLENAVLYDTRKWNISVRDPIDNDSYQINGFDGDRIFEADENSIKLFLVNYKSARNLKKGNYIHINYSDLLHISMRIEDAILYDLKAGSHFASTLVIQLDGRVKIRFS